jgi:hypothetical protein
MPTPQVAVPLVEWEWELVPELVLVQVPELVLVQVPELVQVRVPELVPVPELVFSMPPPLVALPQALAPSPDHRSHAPHCPADVRKRRRRPSPRPTWHTCIYRQRGEESTHISQIIEESTRWKCISIRESIHLNRRRETIGEETQHSAWHTTAASQGSDPAILSPSSPPASSKGSCPAPVDSRSLPPELRTQGSARMWLVGQWDNSSNAQLFQRAPIDTATAAAQMQMQ